MAKDKKLIEQLEKTIKAISAKLVESDEDTVREYLQKYEEALESVVKNGSSSGQRRKLLALLNCARSYLECSSNYNQNFLNEMHVSEVMVKNACGSFDLGA
ncbi:hypothetical protein ACJJIF_19555 [Microbulbifer sp. SSSA002]|uniref:hypothetical protein n=1 Tax=Microbulbifer sp. ZKSA006 TaxID=3243390 RepID=UPI0040391CE6